MSNNVVQATTSTTAPIGGASAHAADRKKAIAAAIAFPCFIVGGWFLIIGVIMGAWQLVSALF